MASNVTTLSVWANGLLVGFWSVEGNGEHRFRYDNDWLNSAAARPISLSIPLAASSYSYRGPAVRDFFDNLLPENRQIRERIQAHFGTGSADAFSLLREIGRDCVGALQILPWPTQAPDVKLIEHRALSDQEIERLLQSGQALGLGRTPPFRISIAGAQEKTALLRMNDTWNEPLGATPTTHILKLPIGLIQDGVDLSTSVENEWLCNRLLGSMGFAVPGCEIIQFGSRKALVVERFDRRWSADGRWIMRIPQEDLCQATGTAAARKYESDGGPGVRTVMQLLVGSSAGAADRVNFFLVQLAFWLLCAIDGHAKNFSIALEAGGRFRLTPFYDVLSAYPILGAGPGQYSRQEVKMAMACWGKNRHYHWDRIYRRHWEYMARDFRLDSQLTQWLSTLEARVSAAIESVAGQLPADFPDSVSEAIFSGVTANLRRLLD